jgi:hypothetical protein
MRGANPAAEFKFRRPLMRRRCRNRFQFQGGGTPAVRVGCRERLNALNKGIASLDQLPRSFQNLLRLP